MSQLVITGLVALQLQELPTWLFERTLAHAFSANNQSRYICQSLLLAASEFFPLGKALERALCAAQRVPIRNPFSLLDPLRHHELAELPYEVPVQFLEHRIEQDQILYSIAHEQQCKDFQYLQRLECTYRKYLDNLKSVTELCEEQLPFTKKLPN